MKAPKAAASDRWSEIGIVEHQERRFAAGGSTAPASGASAPACDDSSDLVRGL